MDSRTDRALALAIELVAFYIRTLAWVLLIWAPLAGAFILLFLGHDEVKRVIAIVLLCLPLIGLLLKWMSTGVFDLKLGRMIVVLLFSAGFAVIELRAVVLMAFHGKARELGGILPGLVPYFLVAAILGYGLIRRSSLLRRTTR
jgi:hypothetical protein